MEKLPMCRVCLVEDVRMYVVVNKEMHELYEKLSNNPFVTTDHRPMLACSFCCTKLKQCCRFQRQCSQAEELFALMLNEDEDREPNPTVNPDYLEFFSGFIKTPVHQISILDENQNVSDAVKQELPDDCETLDDIIQLKVECLSDDYNEVGPEDLGSSLTNVEYTPKLQFESDSDDDVIFVGSQVKAEEDVEVLREKRRADTKRAPDAKKSKQMQRVKHEDVTSEEEKRYEQSESKLKVPPTNANHEVKNISSSSSTSDTSVGNNSDNDDENEHKRLRIKEKRFKCNICQRGFYQKGHLNRHIHTHTDKKRFECGICQCNFTRIDLLFRHMTTHTGEKPFKCDICKRLFSQKNNLKRHSLIHTGEKPYKCDICQYSCNQKVDLKKHIRIHTDEKPYKCDLCSYSCNQKGTLTKHIIRNHFPRKKKPYKKATVV